MSDSEQVFSIQKLYLKDASFESPKAPEVFTQEWKGNTSVQLKTEHQQIDEQHHEVVLHVTVETKSAEQTAYLVEVQQGGVFQVQGFEGDQLGHMLGAFCPNVLFPYVREAVASLVGRGGFPEVQLAPVNFDALYAQHLQQQADRAQAEETTH